LHNRYFYAGVLILIAGLIGATVIYVLTPDDATGGLGNGYLNKRLTEYEIERIGGMATVYVARFNLWLGSLWHGRRLALAVAVIAVVIALVCFWISDRVSAPSTGDQDDDHKD
jgi:hypothetical protein